MEKICKISGRRTDLLVNLEQGAEVIYWGNKLTEPYASCSPALGCVLKVMNI
ncbi:MAG: hypothetical protein ACRDCT_10230 [Shewanella sp.]